MQSARTCVHFLNHDFEYALVLSGDQLYRMDFRSDPRATRRRRRADLTIATHSCGPSGCYVPWESCRSMQERRITRFEEKPKDQPACWIRSGWTRWYTPASKLKETEEFFLASMGIYVFNREVLMELLR